MLFFIDILSHPQKARVIGMFFCPYKNHVHSLPPWHFPGYLWKFDPMFISLIWLFMVWWMNLQTIKPFYWTNMTWDPAVMSTAIVIVSEINKKGNIIWYSCLSDFFHSKLYFRVIIEFAKHHCCQNKIFCLNGTIISFKWPVADSNKKGHSEESKFCHVLSILEF